MMRFVDYDLAMLLREKGYDGGCDAYYHIMEDEDDSRNSFEMTGDCGFGFFNEFNKHRVGAPRIAMVLDWLLYKHDIYLDAVYYSDGKWKFLVTYVDDRFLDTYVDDRLCDDETSTSKGEFDSSNDAYTHGIKHVLTKMIK